MASTTAMHLPRPTPRRASHTWPGTVTPRSHFEDFLREIGADVEWTHLCCRGTSPHPHASHSRHASTKSNRSKVRSSSRAHDKASVSPLSPTRRPTVDVKTRPMDRRGRTMSSPKASGLTNLPVALKSPALSSIDLESHDAPATYNYCSSARNALLTLVGGTPAEGRPSRAPTRTFFREHAPTSRTPDSSSSPSPSPSETMARRSRTRSSARSASPTRSIDSLDTASSSEAPATPRTHSILAHELLPTLDDLERASRFRVDSKCVRCHRTGSNFPSCAKCGERWCSRECRLQSQRGATHDCHGRSATA